MRQEIYDNSSGEEVYEIDLLLVLKELKKHIALILLIALLSAAATFYITKQFITPLYRTCFTVYVNNKSDGDESTNLTSSDVSASRSLASTYAQVITGRNVLEPAAERCGLSAYSYETLENLVDVSTTSATEIITVYVKGTSPKNALYLAQSIAIVAEERISKIVDGSSMRVVDEPFEPTKIFSPNYVKDAVIAAVIGALATCFILAVKVIMDDRIKGANLLEEKYGIPVLGSIPDFESSGKKRYGYYGDYQKKEK